MSRDYIKSNCSGQNMIEHTVVLTLVMAAIITVGSYVVRGWNAQVKGWEDSVVESFEDPQVKGNEDDITIPICDCGPWIGAPPGDCGFDCTEDFCEDDNPTCIGECLPTANKAAYLSEPWKYLICDGDDPPPASDADWDVVSQNNCSTPQESIWCEVECQDPFVPHLNRSMGTCICPEGTVEQDETCVPAPCQEIGWIPHCGNPNDPGRHHSCDQSVGCSEQFGPDFAAVNYDCIKHHDYCRFNRIQCCKVVAE